MSYLTFITIEPHYHQLCSSDLVYEEWIIYGLSQSVLNSLDYLEALPTINSTR
jgi:hypothetical protein